MIRGMKRMNYLLTAAWVLMMHTVARAAEMSTLPEPIKKIDRSWVPFTIALILGVGVCVAAFKRAKRSHLD